MKSKQNNINSIQNLIDSSPEEQHSFREFMAMSNPVPKKEGDHYGEGQYAIWNIKKDDQGESLWEVKEHLSLREKHSWKIQTLSSKRANPNSIRIVLFGGSAAASFGYWGDFSLAKGIEHALNSSGNETYEVIDLSCVNALWDHCIETFKHSLSLKPDKAIFFTGNNEAKSLLARLRARELSHLPSASAALFYETIDDEDTLPLLNKCYEEHMAFEAERSIQLAKKSNVELSFVIPEFNLRDWEGPEKLPYQMSGEKLNEWWKIMNSASQDLENEDYESALVQFEKLSKLDRKTCQKPIFGKAKTLQALGKYTEAKTAFIAARDSGLAPFVRGNPQITTGAKTVLQTIYKKHNISYVDLADLLNTKEMACGREYFIDYCHLNHTGIILLSKAIATSILTSKIPNLDLVMLQKGSQNGQLNFSKAVTSSYQDSMELPISNDENGLGSWVAAIHNYHHGQSKEIVSYWLKDALGKYPQLDTILSFLSDNLCDPWRSRFSIEWFKKHGFFEILGEKQFFFFAKFFYHARFDYELTAIIDEIRKHPKSQRIQTNKAALKGIVEDLEGEIYSLFFMDMRNGLHSGERTAPRSGWEKKCLDIDAGLPTSRVSFPIISSKESTLIIKLAGLEYEQLKNRKMKCDLFFNKKKVAQFKIESGIQRIEVPISKDSFVFGINTLQFNWNHLTSVSDFTKAYERVDYYEKYGYYPCAVRFHSIKLTPNS